jgi:6-phosphogluconolactonase
MVSRIENHAFDTRTALAHELASEIAEQLAAAIAARGQATLAVSGGSTPQLLFQELSQAEIDWSRVTVTLVDERFVPPTSERSNQKLVGDCLLQNKAARAAFLPLYHAERDVDDAAQAAADAIGALPLPLDAVILCMGTDGHTASFFPGGDQLENALDKHCGVPVVTMRAPGAGEARLTLTMPLIASARFLVLHVEGTEKRAVLDQAMDARTVPAEMPVRAVLDDAQTTVHIYWAP